MKHVTQALRNSPAKGESQKLSEVKWKMDMQQLIYRLVEKEHARNVELIELKNK